MKPVEFMGDSLKVLRAFPTESRHALGFQLERVQRGAPPLDWKPMPDVGAGACEIRTRGNDGAFRLLYVAKFRDAVYVLHCFRKKTQKASQLDIDLARARYRDLTRNRR